MNNSLVMGCLCAKINPQTVCPQIPLHPQVQPIEAFILLLRWLPSSSTTTPLSTLFRDINIP